MDTSKKQYSTYDSLNLVRKLNSPILIVSCISLTLGIFVVIGLRIDDRSSAISQYALTNIDVRSALRGSTLSKLSTMMTNGFV